MVDPSELAANCGAALSGPSAYEPSHEGVVGVDRLQELRAADAVYERGLLTDLISEAGNKGLPDDGLSLMLLGGAEAPGEARNALDALDGELDEDLLDVLRLLVSELVTNSFRHGHAGPGDPVTIEISLSIDLVAVAVSDGGPGFEPQLPPRPFSPLSGPLSPLSGWGLFIVDRLADRWGVRQGGRCVWFEVDRSGPPDAWMAHVRSDGRLEP